MSDSSAGQVVGTVVGAVVGFYTGGTGWAAYAAAFQGAAVGYGVGGVVDPPPGPHMKAPPDKQKEFQASTYGAEKADLYGMPIVTGNVIYYENNKMRRVVTEQESGGKGGGGGSTSEIVDYYGTWAVALGNARPGAKVRRLWLGEKLFYDATGADVLGGYYGSEAVLGSVIQSSKNGDKFAFYDGTQTEPNARIASVVGSANAESYEGTMYLMFYDIHMNEYGNSLMGAQVRAEVVCDPVVEPKLIAQVSAPFDADGDSSFYPRAQYLSPFSAGIVDPEWDNTYPTAADYLVYGLASGGQIVERRQSVSDGTSVVPIGMNDIGAVYPTKSDVWADAPATFGTYQNRGGQIIILGTNTVYTKDLTTVYSYTPSFTILSIGLSPAGDIYVVGGSVVERLTADLSTVLVSEAHDRPIPGGGGPTVVTWVDSGIVYIGYSGNNGKESFDLFDSSTLEYLQSFEIPEPYSGTKETSFSVVNGVLTRGGGYSDQGLVSVDHWQVTGIADGGETLSSVVQSICERAAVPAGEINTVALAGDVVNGFASSGGARGSLGVLQAAYLFDIIEDGYGLTCIKRQDTPITVIPEEDLGAAMLGSDSSPRLTVDREMDYQLPRKMTLTFRDSDREQNDGTAEAKFPVQSALEETVDMSLVFDQQQANRIVDVLMKARHIERTGLQFTLPQKYLHLKPGDVVTVQGNDRSYNVRLASVTESAGQIVEVSGKLSAPSLWSSDAVADAPTYVPPVVGYLSDAVSILMDVPLVLDEQDRPSFFLGMYGQGSWPGGTLLRSTDGGQVYSSASGVPAGSTVGEAVNVLDYNAGFVIDRESQLTVVPVSGEFSSVSEAQMMTGANWVAYGADGRWELMRYADATHNADGTVTLTTLLRGLRDTVRYTDDHEVGDKAVLLSTATTNLVGANVQRIGVENLYKGVTFGQEIDEADPFAFTYRGVNLRPYAPIFPQALQSGTDWVFGASARSRYPSSWWTTGVQPQNEPDLVFEADILNGSAVVRTLAADVITDPEFSFTYTEAQQVEDFGEAVSEFTAIIYQLNATIGRGNPLRYNISGSSDSLEIGLLAHYTMSQISGSTLIDETGSHNGTITSVSVGSDVDGEHLLFNGTGYVDLGFNAGVESFAICARVKASPNAGRIFDGARGTGGLGGVAGFQLKGGNASDNFAVDDGSGSSEYIDSSSLSQNYADGTLRDLVAQYDAGTNTMEVWVDGALSATVTDPTVGSIDNSLNGRTYIIGANANGMGTQRWSGRMYDFRLYDRPLTSDEINELHNL